MTGPCSMDSFHYFQMWLVGLGRHAYEAAIGDPDSLADVPEVVRLAPLPQPWRDEDYPHWESLEYVACIVGDHRPDIDAADDHNLSCGPNITEYHLNETTIWASFNPAEGEGRGWADLRYDPSADGYANVFYASGGLQPGDTISMDWRDSATYYHGCHAIVPGGYSTTHTWGVNWVPGREYRLCIDNGKWRCGGWHNFG
jgi:Protein of unknown function (DUF4240)